MINNFKKNNNNCMDEKVIACYKKYWRNTNFQYYSLKPRWTNIREKGTKVTREKNLRHNFSRQG